MVQTPLHRDADSKMSLLIAVKPSFSGGVEKKWSMAEGWGMVGGKVYEENHCRYILRDGTRHFSTSGKINLDLYNMSLKLNRKVCLSSMHALLSEGVLPKI